MSEVNKVKRKGKQPRQNVSGVSESALQAFSTVFAGGGGTSGFRPGANAKTVELVFRQEALTRIGLIIDLSGSRRKTQELLHQVFTESMEVFEQLVGNIELHPIYMYGGVSVAQQAFTSAAEAEKSLKYIDVQNGSTRYMDALKQLRIRKVELESKYPEDVLVHPGHPDIRAKHSDFDALMIFSDRFEDRTLGSSENLNQRYDSMAQQFLSELGVFGVPTFVFHECTKGAAGYEAQKNKGFDPMERVFIPASIEYTKGSYLSFEEYDKPKIMGAIVASAIVMLGDDEATVKHIMEQEPVKGLIDKGEFDPGMVRKLVSNNPAILLPPSAFEGSAVTNGINL